jgi:UDP-glucuronate 4-epimerase
VTILVTGAAGFVGSHLIHALDASGEQVVGLDNFNDYYSPELKKMRVKALIPSPIEVIEADLTNPKSVSEILNQLRPKTVYHLAAQAGVRLDIDNNDLYVQSNLVGFSNILQASIKVGVRNFIYASSSSVYGNSTNVPYSENDHNLSPISFYGASKLSNEFLATALVRGTSTSARGLRFFTVYGPWGRPDMAYLRLAETLINDHEFNLFGSGDAVRDFTYIDDTIHATIALGKQLNEVSPLGSADVVNIGGGKPSSMLELINAFENVSQKTLRVHRLNRVEKDVNQTIADSKKLEQLISFKPNIGLLEGVERVFNWATSSDVSPKLESWTKSVN